MAVWRSSGKNNYWVFIIIYLKNKTFFFTMFSVCACPGGRKRLRRFGICAPEAGRTPKDQSNPRSCAWRGVHVPCIPRLQRRPSFPRKAAQEAKGIRSAKAFPTSGRSGCGLPRARSRSKGSQAAEVCLLWRCKVSFFLQYSIRKPWLSPETIVIVRIAFVCDWIFSNNQSVLNRSGLRREI